MEKEQMLQRLQSLTEEDKSMLFEKLAFCDLADDYDFENYFRIEELNESELLCSQKWLLLSCKKTEGGSKYGDNRTECKTVPG